jgi:O-antigen biosynthesis protein
MDDYYSPLKIDYTVKYDDKPRLDLLQLINEAPGRVLEIGCGAGATGAVIKQKYPDTIYIGMELQGSASAVAQTRLDRVFEADIEKVDLEQLGIEKGSLGLVICADVLEHLYDPWKVLHAVRQYLKPGGKILASIPNVQNISLIQSLILGNWTYEKYGLLDATHIRFFTLNEIFRLFRGTGYNVVHCATILQYNVEEGVWPKDLEFGKVVIRNVSKEEATMLFTFQYLVTAIRPE